jgi:hypothetical protein
MRLGYEADAVTGSDSPAGRDGPDPDGRRDSGRLGSTVSQSDSRRLRVRAGSDIVTLLGNETVRVSQ